MSNNEKKDTQLGVAHGTANGKLRKMLLFKYVIACGDGICFRCGKVIDNIDNFSIDHKIAWLDSKDPIGLFFDLDNIAFSHVDCNARSRRTAKRLRNHGHSLYRDGCRCPICYNTQVAHNRRRTENKRSKDT